MSFIFSDTIDNILSIGVFLGEYNINNWALDKDRAIKALNSLAAGGISVLGGDVICNTDGDYHHNDDNWYCEKKPSESNEDFLTRSIEYAKEYIVKYPKHDVLFVIVPE